MNPFTSHLRLTILRVLKESPAYEANSSVIQGVAIEFGLQSTRDQIITELSWLDEQGLIATKPVGKMVVASITDRGLDVAAGRAVVPGVQRPAPES